MTMGPDGGGWQGADEPIWPGGPWNSYGPMRQASPAIGAGGHGTAPAWGAPFPPARPAGSHRTYAFLIVAGALVVVVVLVALVTVAVSFVRTEIRRYIVPSNGFVQPVPSVLGPSGSLLTPSITTAVVNEEWTVFANAGLYATAGELSRIASPGAVDLMISRRVCGCGSWPAAYSSLEVTAPLEPTYPLSFLAEIDQQHDSAGAQIQVAIFGKQSASAPWLIMYLSGYGGSERSLYRGTLLSQEPPRLLPGAQPFVSMAELLASERQTGAPPRGDFWDSNAEEGSGEIADVADNLRETYDDDQNAGLQASADFYVANYSPAFSAGSYGAQCAEIIGRVLVTSKYSTPVVQPQSGTAFGPLAPGNYSSVTEMDVYELCMDQRTTDYVFAIALSGNTYSFAGVPVG
jgi:hypothetical protein